VSVPTAAIARVTRRRDIQGLRAVAVLAVLLFHAGVPGVTGGFIGVDVFFVLSGFLISGALWRELAATGRVRLAAFWARRARRLLPSAALVGITTVVASALLLSPLRGRSVVRDALAAALYALNYRLAAQGTDYLSLDSAPSPLQHYWSLGVEEQFYLGWPLLLLVAALAGRRRRSARAPVLAAVVAVVGVVAVASFAVSLHLTDAAQPFAFFSLPSRAWEFAVGAAVALAAGRLRGLRPGVAAVLGWCGLAGLGVGFVGLGAATPFPGVAALLPVLGTAAVLAAGCARAPRGPMWLLGRAPLQLGGRISYAWYLWHWPPLVLVPALLGHPLTTVQSVALVVLSGLLAFGSTVALEEPIRGSRRLSVSPGRGLALGGGLTAAACACAVIVGAMLPSLRGTAPAAATPALTSALASALTRPAAAHGARRPALTALQVVQAQVSRALLAATAVRAVPSDLRPGLDVAHGDKAAPFLDGCHLGYDGTASPPCAYGDVTAAREVVLFGDSHATQWFPPLQRMAAARRTKLVDLTKSICPPVEIPVWQPGQGRPYRECEQWRAAVLERVRTEHPGLVVLGVARHYGPEYRFTVYGPAWVSGLASMVTELRAAGTTVVVLGPTPLPGSDVPECLAEHPDDARACATPLRRAVDAGGEEAERRAVVAAGGRYLDVARLACTPAVCPPVVGNLLVYRDTNHLTTTYTGWLTPLLDDALAEVWPRR